MASDISIFELDEEIETKNETVISNDLDYCDVIPETPQKIQKKKNIKKCSKTREVDLSVTSEFNFKLSVGEFNVNRNDANNTNIKNYTSLNVQYKQPYTFFEISEILNFTTFYQPVNPKLKIVGFYKQQHTNTHYLMERQKFQNVTPQSILLDMNFLQIFPTNDAAIEAYGFITFQNKVNSCLPVFFVEFWTSVGSHYNKYLQCLKRQKLYIPSCYKDIKNFNVSSFLECADYTFVEMDESCLNRKLEYIEHICDEIDQIMNISDDVFA